MEEANRPWILERRKNSVQLLACPGEIQLGKFPDFVHAPDELALDFDNFRMAFVGNFRAELTDKQRAYLHAIDQSLSQMPTDCFSPEGVLNSPEWENVRSLAAETLKAFGWPSGDPPRRDHEFVPDKRT
jgi:hypothetical protein